MASSGDVRAAWGLLALALFGVLARWMATPGVPPGAVGYQGSGGNRPARQEVLELAEVQARPLGPTEQINVDEAGAFELVRLPGVGAKLAARIVEDRESNGPFGSLEALGRVPGIGQAMVERLRPHLGFSRRPFVSQGKMPDLVSLNTASEADLVKLPGIGPQKAAAIVASRLEDGPFENVEDITRVAGIGPATLERLRPLITVR